MILVQNKGEITLNIPKNTSNIASALTFSLYSQGTVRSFEFEVEDKGTDPNFYIITLDLDIPYGEYEYSINGDKGLLRIGKAVAETQYNAKTNYQYYGE